MDNTGETGKRYTIIAVIETNAMIELPETDNIHRAWILGISTSYHLFLDQPSLSYVHQFSRTIKSLTKL